MPRYGIYTRKDMANKEFSANEKQNIIKYLNDQFYQFR
jgi:hypothetical protein